VPRRPDLIDISQNHRSSRSSSSSSRRLLAFRHRATRPSVLRQRPEPGRGRADRCRRTGHDLSRPRRRVQVNPPKPRSRSASASPADSSGLRQQLGYGSSPAARVRLFASSSGTAVLEVALLALRAAAADLPPNPLRTRPDCPSLERNRGHIAPRSGNCPQIA